VRCIKYVTIYISYFIGVVPVDRQALFERMLFRVSRGNVLARFTPIDVDVVDPATAIAMRKSVFTVIFMGQQMKRRISKIIQVGRDMSSGVMLM